MKYIQTKVLKFIIIIGLFFSVSPSFALNNNPLLARADSLFTARQYTQSFDLYQELLKSNRYTPAMLLKMAFIQEGLGRAGYALYFINLYYLASGDEMALTKMEELATKNNLKGYEQSMVSRSLFVYSSIQHLVGFALAALTLIMVALLVYLKRRQASITLVTVFTVLLVVLLVAQNNYVPKENNAIVIQPNTYLMDGPSAGANVVGIIGEGHRLKVVGHRDVWLKVNWLGRDVFVKENQAQPVAL